MSLLQSSGWRGNSGRRMSATRFRYRTVRCVNVSHKAYCNHSLCVIVSIGVFEVTGGIVVSVT